MMNKNEEFLPNDARKMNLLEFLGIMCHLHFDEIMYSFCYDDILQQILMTILSFIFFKNILDLLTFVKNF